VGNPARVPRTSADRPGSAGRAAGAGAQPPARNLRQQAVQVRRADHLGLAREDPFHQEPVHLLVPVGGQILQHDQAVIPIVAIANGRQHHAGSGDPGQDQRVDALGLQLFVQVGGAERSDPDLADDNIPVLGRDLLPAHHLRRDVRHVFQAQRQPRLAPSPRTRTGRHPRGSVDHAAVGYAALGRRRNCCKRRSWYFSVSPTHSMPMRWTMSMARVLARRTSAMTCSIPWSNAHCARASPVSPP
jgi:hypothetical protein